jgi:hypothetical protein
VRPQSLQLTSSSGHVKNGTALPMSLASKTPDPRRTNGISTVNKRHSVGSKNAPLSANPVKPVPPANSKGAETKSNEPPAPVPRHPAQSHSQGNDPTIASRRNSKNPSLRPPTATSGPGSGIGSETGPGSGPGSRSSSGPTPLSGGNNAQGNNGNRGKTGSKNANGTDGGSGSKSESVASKAEVASTSSAFDTTPKQSCCAIA